MLRGQTLYRCDSLTHSLSLSLSLSLSHSLTLSLSLPLSLSLSLSHSPSPSPSLSEVSKGLGARDRVLRVLRLRHSRRQVWRVLDPGLEQALEVLEALEALEALEVLS